MTSKIIDREEIVLNQPQNKMIISVWGEDALNNSIVERITYLSDGLKVKGYLAYPNNKITNQKFPCIIWNRGGYGNKGAIDHFTARGIFGQIASWGYVVFMSQYRGNAGSEGREELGGCDVDDILNLILLADELDFTDKNKWGIEGWSRGGMMTLLTLKQNHNFKCAILSGAISNIKQNALEHPELKIFYQEIIGSKNFEDELEKRSAINFVNELPDIHYLILHGGSDKTISVNQSIELAKNFTKLNYKFRLMIFEDGDHFLKNHRKEVDKQRCNWYEKYLK